MQYYTNYVSHEKKIVGKRKKVDNTVFSFDIETTSYIILNNKIFSGVEYDNFTEIVQLYAVSIPNEKINVI